MYNLIVKWYHAGIWALEHVQAAVGKGWITAGQYREITGEDYIA